MRLGFIGLGKMGSRMAAKLLADGHNLVVWNRSEQAISNFKFQISNFKYENQKLKIVKTIEELIKSLEKPRVIWTMVTAGEATQDVLDELAKFVEPGDIIIDGGNSYYKDTERRYQKLRNEEIGYLGIGVSGGVIGSENGYPLMVGGDKGAYEFIKPILDSLAKLNGGHEYFGVGGAGHFVKMVHNGIEYGIMQSLAEGFGVLQKAEYNFDLLKIAKLWQKGTLVSGFMLDCVVEALSKDSQLSKIVGYIEESGEAGWTVEQGKAQNVPVEVIEKSLEFRLRSQKESDLENSFAAKMIAALRSVFGGHEIRKR